MKPAVKELCARTCARPHTSSVGVLEQIVTAPFPRRPFPAMGKRTAAYYKAKVAEVGKLIIQKELELHILREKKRRYNKKFTILDARENPITDSGSSSDSDEQKDSAGADEAGAERGVDPPEQAGPAAAQSAAAQPEIGPPEQSGPAARAASDEAAAAQGAVEPAPLAEAPAAAQGAAAPLLSAPLLSAAPLSVGQKRRRPRSAVKAERADPPAASSAAPPSGASPLPAPPPDGSARKRGRPVGQKAHDIPIGDCRRCWLQHNKPGHTGAGYAHERGSPTCVFYRP